MRRPAKLHVATAVRFWAIANIRGGGGCNAPPPVKRELNFVDYFSFKVGKLQCMFVDYGA